MDRIDIEGHEVGEGQPCFIIAEVGVNHNGDPELAMKMIKAAAEAGADCVKFQTFRAQEFVNDAEETYTYTSKGREVTESMLEMFQRLELKQEDFARLFEHTRELGLVPLSTPTDREAVDLLDELGAGAFKIGSDDLVYTPFLEYMAAKGKPVILSTGMAGMEDVERAVAAVRGAGNEQIVLLHCVSLYPTPDDQVNLHRIAALREKFGLAVGFSDHSSGITAALGAVALGGCMVEKHFTLDRNFPGPDHWFSADPAELKELVSALRRMEAHLGAGDATLGEGEQDMASLAHRSIVASADLPAGHCIGEGDLAFRRPGTGLMPYEMDKIIGRRTREVVAAGTLLNVDMFEDDA
ncbi:MAG: N-acetylneuraminate synthase family protein [Alphaproteobacteria bacterium]|jgi:N-acetylneuraminate synthase/N,N'-diacetyllegionaminate synthase|nr:N-acetylneuraminate synthase family protein [Alphaproteobacteria bacterium]